MRKSIAALRALAELREALAWSDAEEKGRVWVRPYSRTGQEVAGYWREIQGGFPRDPGDIMQMPEGERPPWNPPLHPEIARRIKDEKLYTWPPKGEVTRRILGDAHDLQEKFSIEVDGKRHYSPERLKLHNKIIAYFLNNHDGQVSFERPLGNPTKEPHASHDQPEILFYAGGTASGKSSALRLAQEHGSSFAPEDAVILNPDLIKQMLPEYAEAAYAGDQYAGTMAHEESSDITKKILEAAQAAKMNVIVDGTGDSGRDKFLGKLNAAKERSYNVKVFMVDLPLNPAVERMVLRGDLDGRYVPTKEMKKNHYGAAGRFFDWKNLDIVSAWELWSNNVPPGSDPILVARGGNGKEEIFDEYEYERIRDKARRDKA